MVKNRISKFILGLLLACFLLCSSGFITTVYAEEQPIQEIDRVIFVSFKKGENSTNGRYLTACFFIPKSVYHSNYTSGVCIFPKSYIAKYDLTGDYLRRMDEESIAILNVEGGATELDEGAMFKCGVYDIPEGGCNMEMAFVFYIKDAEGNVSYTEPEISSWNGSNDREYSNQELYEKILVKLGIYNNFGMIVCKISELVDSFWIYMILAMASVVVVWGAVIGVKIITAKKNESKIDAMGMVKNLIIGIVIMFVIAFAVPLLLKGMTAWTGGRLPVIPNTPDSF